MHGVLSRFFALALEAAHRYEGTVNQFLGDGFMALFGAPVAHEEHARRAALAALEIRRVVGTRAEHLDLPAGAELSVRMGFQQWFRDVHTITQHAFSCASRYESPAR